jgi:hypothetical protein
MKASVGSVHSRFGLLAVLGVAARAPCVVDLSPGRTAAMLSTSGRAPVVQLLGRPFGLLNPRNVISPNFIADGGILFVGT